MEITAMRHKGWARAALAAMAAVLLIRPALAQTETTMFHTAIGRNSATVVNPTAGSSAFSVTFGSEEWPNAFWTPGLDQSWDWKGHAALALTIHNPNTVPVTFGVRVDDDPSADGTKHCAQAQATLPAGKTATYVLDLGQDDPMDHGMRGGPPAPGRVGFEPLSAAGKIDPSHVIGFQVFLHQPLVPTELEISDLHLLPTSTDTARYDGIVDGFGQFAHADWPGKVHHAEEFASRRAAEDKELAAHPALPGRDEYGGWADGPKVAATGFFHTLQRDGRWWLVTPTGHLFLSFGVDAISHDEPTIVQPRDAMFTSLPNAPDPLVKHYGDAGQVLYGPNKTGKTFDFYAANLERKYGVRYEELWGLTTLKRLKSWGFNTVGNWSDIRLGMMKQVPYTATLGVGGAHATVSSGSDYWGQMPDPYDPQFAADAQSAFQETTARVKNDPWCVGYFVDNELSWGGGNVEGGRYGLAYGALASKSDQPAKHAFLAQLLAKYGTIDKINAAWGTSLTGWNDLSAPYKASETPNQALKDDMGAFVHAFAKQYFTVIRDILKKQDPDHLYLGCRFAWKTPEAIKAAAEVCDAVSFNVYEPRLDPHDWDSMAELAKPCLIGEFHFGALDRGMFSPGLVNAQSQAGRGKMFEDYIHSVADNPAFVGAHWFQYTDEALTGRPLDGENYNIGLVSVTDTPYPELISAARHVFTDVYARHAAAKVYQGKIDP